LIVKTLGIADKRGSALQPRVAAMLVHKAPVICHCLTLVDNYSRTKSFTDQLVGQRDFSANLMVRWFKKLQLIRLRVSYFHVFLCLV